MTDDLHKRDAVTRWGPYAVDGGCDAYGAMEEDENGDYVGYEDHCAETAALLARLEAVERERRNGAHLMEVAKSLGWPDDGEGAFNFITRRTREVAIDDCAERAEVALATARREAELLNRIVLPMVEQRSREKGDAWDQAAAAIRALAAQEGEG